MNTFKQEILYLPPSDLTTKRLLPLSKTQIENTVTVASHNCGISGAITHNRSFKSALLSHSSTSLLCTLIREILGSVHM